MNKFLEGVHRLFCRDLIKNDKADALRAKIMNGKQKDIRELKKTNGIIKVMIEKGEIELKIR